MFTVNDDLSIYATRGDTVFFSVAADDAATEQPYKFNSGDLLRIKIFGKKDAENVVMQKDFPITGELDSVAVLLTEEDTKFGPVISKPTDYWYEVELNPNTNPQTIIGYDEDGPKVFKLFPEGADIPPYIPEEEELPAVDWELDGTSTRPVQNQAIVRAINTITGTFNETKRSFDRQAAMITGRADDIENAIAVERARVDNFVSGPTTDNSELIDIRIGADGKNYASAGTAVRRQFSYLADEINALKEVVDVGFTVGTITGGVDDYHANRAKFTNRIKACRTVVSIPVNSVYLYGYAGYDDNGNYDGIDHGWNAMDGNDLLIQGGYFKMNFRKVSDTAMTDEDLETLKGLIAVTQFNIVDDVEKLKYQASEGTLYIPEYAVELGSLANGEKVDFLTRARFVEPVKINKKTKVIVQPSDLYMFGYCVYDDNGVFDGVDHQWNSPKTLPTVTFEKSGYVSFNFRRTDSADITNEDMEVLSGLLTIENYKSVLDVAEEVEALRKDTQAAENSAMNSIVVEYGRVNGASYVFARIPKTTNDGGNLRPVLRFTSIDGSMEGSKASALSFAKRNNAIFTLNAGLFNTGTLLPVGQTILDGVSYVNTPMVDDMGSPISAEECYPLCIDADGNLSAPYGRSVDTATMIADGVVHAVTGWGKVVDNFKACPDTVENEIVHAETYIRQIVGQFQNGDYFVCTVDKSRGDIVNEAGLTYKDLAAFLIAKGVKFAYSLDGGGSAETVIGKRQLNPIYEGSVGRAVPTVISFE